MRNAKKTTGGTGTCHGAYIMSMFLYHDFVSYFLLPSSLVTADSTEFDFNLRVLSSYSLFLSHLYISPPLPLPHQSSTSPRPALISTLCASCLFLFKKSNFYD